MIIPGLAAVARCAFLVAVAREPRSFGNAVLLGLAPALGALAVAQRLAAAPDRAAHLLLLALVLAVVPAGFTVLHAVLPR